ncbi:MAG: hypothetical protein I3273_02295 [Candidatus Moeniiplasma glomeromycotorum]|nr:hypothetical protein [Candidatus Moeniiplasma glomeromycotorum]MCE8167052.1 hypothetical protein [Candidatus Moeniiplasma glomeromycotorum]MCE8168936.1 hypothetical protein [Candidatus Moeniiplasma glomeromycotorum]
MTEVKKFSITFNRRFKEMMGGYLILDQLNNQVNLHLGKGTWYAKSYHAQESENGSVILSVDVIKVS